MIHDPVAWLPFSPETRRRRSHAPDEGAAEVVPVGEAALARDALERPHAGREQIGGARDPPLAGVGGGADAEVAGRDVEAPAVLVLDLAAGVQVAVHAPEGVGERRAVGAAPDGGESDLEHRAAQPGARLAGHDHHAVAARLALRVHAAPPWAG